MIEHFHQIAAHAYYVDELPAGRRACEQLLRNRLSAEREQIVRRNRTWYTQRIDELIPARFVQLDLEPAREGWSLFNPSLVARPTGFLVNIRSSNYRIVNGRYVMPEADGDTIKTQNIVAHLSDDLVVSDRRLIAAEYASTDFNVHGLEDVRLNVVEDQVVASATVRNFDPHDGTCRMATATLDLDANAYTGIKCHGTPAGRNEKNWMPIIGRREWLYGCHARGHVATVHDAGDDWQVDGHAEAPQLASGFRGGSQLVEVSPGIWMAIVHEVAEDDGRRIYEHRIVEFDEADGWRIVAVSPPFVFREPRSIEFCAGLAVKGLRLVATFGVRDCEAFVVEMSLADVWRLMNPV